MCVYGYTQHVCDVFVLVFKERLLFFFINLQLNFSKQQIEGNLSNPFKLQTKEERFFFLTIWCIMEGHLKFIKGKREKTKQISSCSFDS